MIILKILCLWRWSMVPAHGLCFSYSTGIRLKRTKQKSQGNWADPRGLRHQVKTKTKHFEILTLSDCTVWEPEIAKQCLRVPWWGLYWYYNASVISICLKILKRRPISTQFGIKLGGGERIKRGNIYICAFILYFYIEFVIIHIVCLSLVSLSEDKIIQAWLHEPQTWVCMKQSKGAAVRRWECCEISHTALAATAAAKESPAWPLFI